MLTAITMALLLSGAPVQPKNLLGTWKSASWPGDMLVLLPNGTGAFNGAAFTWKQQDQALVVTSEDGSADRLSYTLDGDLLTLTIGKQVFHLKRQPPGAGPPKLKRIFPLEAPAKPQPKQAKHAR